MSLITQIEEEFLLARKSKDSLAKNILSVVIGEIQNQQSRTGQRGEVTDAQVVKIMQKLIKANEETIQAAAGGFTLPEHINFLVAENALLQRLLPKECTREEILAYLVTFAEGIQSASGDGPATGIAMKALAGLPGAKDGKLVAAVVKEMRAP